MQPLVSSISKCFKQNSFQTYNPPRPNTMIKLYFCFFGSRRAFRTGIGRITHARSVTMLNDALQNQNARRSKQWPPLMVLSQKYATGRQEMVLPINVQRPYSATIEMRTQQIRRGVATKNRWYCSKMESLVKVRPRLYTMTLAQNRYDASQLLQTMNIVFRDTVTDLEHSSEFSRCQGVEMSSHTILLFYGNLSG